MKKEYNFEATLYENNDGGAFVIFPWDIREEFGQGRLKVHAESDGI